MKKNKCSAYLVIATAMVTAQKVALAFKGGDERCLDNNGF